MENTQPSQDQSGMGLYESEAVSVGTRIAQLGTETLKAVAQVEACVSQTEAEVITWGQIEKNINPEQIAIEIEFGFALGNSLRALTFIDKGQLGTALGITADDLSSGPELSDQDIDMLAEAIDGFLQSFQSSASSYFPTSDGEMPFALQLVSLTSDHTNLPEWLNEQILLKVSHLLSLPNGTGAAITHISPIEIIEVLGATKQEEEIHDSNVISLVDELLNSPAASTPEPARTPAAVGATSSRTSAPAGSGVSVRPAEFSPLPMMGEASAPRSIDLIMDVSLKVSVELGRSTMSIKDILALGPGSVIELDKLAGEAVDIMVNDRLIARGEVVVVDENFGVRVTEIINANKRNASA